MDPFKRPSAAQAMKNFWFELNKIEFELSRDFIHECFNNLMDFSPDLKFQQSVLAYMVHNFVDHDEIKEIKHMFVSFDLDNDGRLSHEELAKGFKRYIRIIPNEKQFFKIIGKIDQDKSGFIHYEEFIRVVFCKKKLLSENNLIMFFRLFDKEETNSISLLELKNILRLSSRYRFDIWNEIFSEIEHLKNNEITYDEFRQIMIE
jgi:Ca2+-binding EF-hand superfamily protein